MNTHDFKWPSEDELAKIAANYSPLCRLPDKGEAFCKIMRASGREQAGKLREELAAGSIVLLVGRPIDFEGFVPGMVEILEANGIDVRIGCLWLNSGNANGPGFLGSLAMSSYVDVGHEAATHAFLVSSLLDDWNPMMTSFLWTRHRAPTAALGIVGHYAEEHELEAALAEMSLAGGISAGVNFSSIGNPHEFDKARDISNWPPADDVLHVPSFLEERMKARVQRRRGS